MASVLLEDYYIFNIIVNVEVQRVCIFRDQEDFMPQDDKWLFGSAATLGFKGTLLGTVP